MTGLRFYLYSIFWGIWHQCDYTHFIESLFIAFLFLTNINDYTHAWYDDYAWSIFSASSPSPSSSSPPPPLLPTPH